MEIKICFIVLLCREMVAREGEGWGTESGRKGAKFARKAESGEWHWVREGVGWCEGKGVYFF